MRIRKHSARTKKKLKDIWRHHINEWIRLSKKPNETPNYIQHMIEFSYNQL